MNSRKQTEKTVDAFYALLRAGLWEQSIQLMPFEPLDFDALYKLSDDQSVVGLIAAGLEFVEDRKVTKPEALQFLKKVFSLEVRNKEMNAFIERLILKLRNAGIYSLLIKGQGVAQSYERPLWRSSGDVDLLLGANHYNKAKRLLIPLSVFVDEEDTKRKHLGMTIDSWTVELHGTLYGGLPKRINRVLDQVQDDSLEHGNVCGWRNGNTDVFLPSADNSVIIVFTHILQHFFRGGIGLRQVCDWCRLLWTYRGSINLDLLEKRLREMRLMTEWKVFASYAVDYLGMPVEVLPFYDSTTRWSQKADRINAFILEVGNFGQNRDKSYYDKYPYVVYKVISLWSHVKDFFRHFMIFPIDSFSVFMRTIIVGMNAVGNGK